jgi:hypothetical protein
VLTEQIRTHIPGGLIRSARKQGLDTFQDHPAFGDTAGARHTCNRLRYAGRHPEGDSFRFHEIVSPASDVLHFHNTLGQRALQCRGSRFMGDAGGGLA